MKQMTWKQKVAILIMVLILSAGCFREVAQFRGQLPDIIWPKPPEIPRIRFVNSISRPEDINIRPNILRKFFRFVKGEQGTPIVKPSGIATDADARLFVVDTFSRFVHVFDSGNGTYYTFPEKGTSFLSPIGIALDKRGFIYVSDSQEGVIKIFNDHGRKFIKDIGKNILKRPTGIAVNHTTNELLVADTAASEIVRFDTVNHDVKGIIGGNGSEPGLFHYPTHIFVSRDGRLFVSDSLNFRVQIFSPEGNFLDAFGKPGDSPGYFAQPKGIAVDNEGNIYVADALFDTVQVFDRKGRLLMNFGGPGNGYGEFWIPSGIFIDSNNRIYVADSYNRRIQVFQYMKGDHFLSQ